MRERNECVLNKDDWFLRTKDSNIVKANRNQPAILSSKIEPFFHSIEPMISYAMNDFLFYIRLGLEHVLDFNAYDHILFLSALAIPFTFHKWRPVLLLATMFTLTHCLALALSVYGILAMDVGLVEFLIPVTIVLTALFNLVYQKSPEGKKNIVLHLVATAFFGLVHGFGFSNYFRMLVMGQDEKLVPLFGFATGIELSQITIVLSILGIAFVFQSILRVKQPLFVIVASILVILLTIPVLITTFPI